MGKTAFAVALSLALALVVASCANTSGAWEESAPASRQSASPAVEEHVSTQQPGAKAEVQGVDDAEEDNEMRMSIGGTDVNVEWERNQAVVDLQALAANGPITVELSMYGGFEQVGSLGSSLTASDVQMTTEPGDIVLYAGNQISVFYGANSWAYTKLGHITDRTADEMAELLGNGDVDIVITIL